MGLPYRMFQSANMTHLSVFSSVICRFGHISPVRVLLDFHLSLSFLRDCKWYYTLKFILHVLLVYKN